MNNKILYWGLIITFGILYAATGFVSFYHAIELFSISNEKWLAVILSLVFEIGQSSVLFSILLTKNRKSPLAWGVMTLLTIIQIVGNVVSTYKFIETSNRLDFQYFQKTILFWVEAEGVEMFKVIISYLTGGILPIIALAMTSLVVENIKLKEESDKEILESIEKSKIPLVELEEKSNDNSYDIKKEEIKPVDEISSNNWEDYLNKSLDENDSKIDTSEIIEEKESEIVIEPITNEIKEDIKPIKESKPKKKDKKKDKKTPIERVKIKDLDKKVIKKDKKIDVDKQAKSTIKSISQDEIKKEISEPKPDEIKSKEGDEKYASLIKDNIEVIDVKAVPKGEKGKIDKFGIPIKPNERQNYDKI